MLLAVWKVCLCFFTCVPKLTEQYTSLVPAAATLFTGAALCLLELRHGFSCCSCLAADNGSSTGHKGG